MRDRHRVQEIREQKKREEAAIQIQKRGRIAHAKKQAKEKKDKLSIWVRDVFGKLKRIKVVAAPLFASRNALECVVHGAVTRR